MRVWIYCYCKERSSRKLEEQRSKMLAFAGKRRMEVMGITVLNAQNESQLKEVIKSVGRMRGDAILIYDLGELPQYERMLLLDAIYQRKITIICCKYSGKEVI